MHILHSGGWPHNYFPTNIYQGPKRAEITLEFEDIARIQMPITLQELRFPTAWWCTFFIYTLHLHQEDLIPKEFRV